MPCPSAQHELPQVRSADLGVEFRYFFSCSSNTRVGSSSSQAASGPGWAQQVATLAQTGKIEDFPIVLYGRLLEGAHRLAEKVVPRRAISRRSSC
jgi:hypothetical protein